MNLGYLRYSALVHPGWVIMYTYIYRSCSKRRNINLLADEMSHVDVIVFFNGLYALDTLLIKMLVLGFSIYIHFY